MRQTRVMHTWKFGDTTQFVWTPGTDSKGFEKLVEKERHDFVAKDVRVGFMRIENVFSPSLGRYVPSTVIADHGEGDPVVYAKLELKRLAVKKMACAEA